MQASKPCVALACRGAPQDVAPSSVEKADLIATGTPASRGGVVPVFRHCCTTSSAITCSFHGLGHDGGPDSAVSTSSMPRAVRPPALGCGRTPSMHTVSPPFSKAT
jgi:hypothetical protein